MSRTSSIRPLVVLCAVGIALIGAGYFVLRGQATARERYFTERYERSVATLATQIGVAFESYVSSFAQAVRGAERQRQRTGKTLREHLEIALPSTSFRPQTADAIPCELAYRRAGFCPNSAAVSQTKNDDRTDARSTAKVHTAATLYFCVRHGSDDRSEVCVQSDIGELFEKSIVGTSLEEIDVALFDDRGRVTFSHGSGPRFLRWLDSKAATGPGRVTPEATPGPNSGHAAEWPALEGVRAIARTAPVLVDGRSDWLVTQPIRVSLAPTGDVLRILANGLGDAGKDSRSLQEAESEIWVLAAVVPLEMLRGESRTVSSWIVALTAFLLLFGLALPPLLKIWTVGPRDRVRPSDVHLASLSVLVLAGLTVIAILTAGSYAVLEQEGDRELRRRATTIARGFDDLLRSGHDELAAFLAARRQPDALTSKPDPESFLECSTVGETRRCASVTKECALELKCGTGVGTSPPRASVALRANGPLSAFYDQARLLRLIVLSDQHGDQLEKWSPGATVTEQINMRSFRTFRDIVPAAGDAPRLTRLASDGKTRDLAFNIQASPNTGQVLAVVSLKPNPEDPWRAAIGLFENPLPETDAERKMPTALLATRVRKGEFAVINTVGQVLLHSHPQRRIHENFRAECARCDDLYSSLAAGTPDEMDLEYHGRPKRAASINLSGTPYWVVALHDKERLRTAAFEMFTLSFATFALGTLIILATAGTFVGFRDRRSSRWIWPHRGEPGRYVGACAGLLGLIALSMHAVGTLESTPAFVATVSLAVIAISAAFLGSSSGSLGRSALACVAFLLAFATLLSTTRSPTETVAWMLAVLISLAVGFVCRPPARWLGGNAALEPLFVASALLLLIVTAVLPALAAFRDAFLFEVARFHELARRDARSDVAAEDGATTPPPTNRSNATRVPRLLDEGGAGLPGFLDDAWRAARSHADGLFEGVASVVASPPESQIHWPHLTQRMAAWLPYVNREAIELRRTVPTSVPALAATLSAFGGLTIGALLSVSILCGWFLIRGLVRSLFGTHVTDDRSSPRQVADTAAGDLWLDPSIDEINLCRLQNPTAVCVDLHAYASSEDLRDHIGNAANARRVLILHLEHRIDEPDWNRAKLDLLEAVLFTGPEKTFVRVLSEVDVLAYMSQRLRSPGDPANDENYLSSPELDRWSVVLDRLAKRPSSTRRMHNDIPAPLRDSLAEECRWTSRLLGIEREVLQHPLAGEIDGRDLAMDVCDRASAHYRLLWSACTDEERLVLLHLARDGFISPRSWRVVRRLFARRLVRWTPALRVMNETFRRFVATVEDEGVIQRWERAGGLSSWRKLQVVLVVSFVVVAFVLYATRPDQLTGMLAFLTALGGGAATLVQLMGFLRTRTEAATEIR